MNDESSDANGPDTASPPAAAPPETGSGAPGVGRAWTVGIAAVCAMAALFVGRAWGLHDAEGGRPGSGAQAADPAANEVNLGLAATDPSEAVAHFRKALDESPMHYGATFQLARALDRAGRKDEAKAQWERVLRMAQQSGDQPLVDQARARLGVAATPPATVPADPMLQGLDALYSKRDPTTAIARFREVLAQSPEHYGATFQLATALDQAGDVASSRPVWEKMLAMSETIGDAKTGDAARARLIDIDKQLGVAPAPPDPDAEAMRAAVDALYVKKDVQIAIPLFQAILKRNARHYGAMYQLAAALDRAKKPAEARPVWEKVLKMAEAIGDEKTASAARTRLAQKP